MPGIVSGTEGYADEAERLRRQYESIAFADVHAAVMHLFPSMPGRVLDIGAGTGRDAAAFAAMGHRVVAVEPTAELRRIAMELHVSPAIEWIDDGLPELVQLASRDGSFDVVMLTAVWMHLDAEQRRCAMPNVAALLATGGLMCLSLRHGPVPAGRRMFEVGEAETTALAKKHGLDLVLARETPSVQVGAPDVTWTRLAFRRSVIGD